MAQKPPPKKKGAGKSKGRGGGLERWLLGGIIVSLIVIGLILWGPLRKYSVLAPTEHSRPETAEPKSQPQKADPAKSPSRSGAAAKSAPALLGGAPSGTRMSVAIVIDDLGADIRQAREILGLAENITVAVMPHLAQSQRVAGLARQTHHEVLLHLPMEYRGKRGSPAVGMLRSDMTPMDFLSTVSGDVESVPGAIGINNHEGSALTENKEAMKFLMAELKARNLMFLDSVTSPKTIAFTTAREFDIRTGRRDVFLDNEGNNAGEVRKQLAELVAIARKRGNAIAIGHPYPATITELRSWLPEAKNLSIEIVPISTLLH